ncbi:hypothetical protein BH23BAC1_BH23BAC1_38050 [soil metagenome]
MKAFKIFLFLLILIAYHYSFGQNKALLIILDGIPPDVMEKTPTPAIDEISKRGAYTHAYIGGEKGTFSESPTVSAVGYNHIITGTWSHKHNVFDNKIENPNYNYWNISRMAEASDKGLKTAIFSTWEDNRTKLIGENLKAAGNIKIDYSFDGFESDTVNFPHENEDHIHKIDEHVSKEAARYIKQEGPDLSWVYLQYTDDVGHHYGDSPEMTEAVKAADQQVSRIWNAVKERENSSEEKWMVIITTDHGRTSSDGKGHGGQSERERKTWIVTNYKDLNDRFKQNPSAVDIAPTIVRFLNLKLPEEVAYEMDGVPLIGKVSISNLSGKLKGEKIEINWKALIPEGNLEIFIATENKYSKGEADHYTKVGTAKVNEEMYTFNFPNYKSTFYKILVKAPHNNLNTWIVVDQANKYLPPR